MTGATPAGADDFERAAFGGGLGAHGGEVIGREVAAIGFAGGEHGVRDLRMAGGAGGLEDGLFIAVEAEPVQPVQDGLGGGVGAAGAVGVFHAEQEGAAVVAGEEVVEQRGAGAADMQHAGGGRGETGANGHLVFQTGAQSGAKRACDREIGCKPSANMAHSIAAMVARVSPRP